MITRRQLLGGAASLAVLGAGGLLGVEQGWLPGRVALGDALGRCNVDAALPDDEPGPLQESVFTSTYRSRDVTWMLALPPGADAAGLPVALVLHGRGGDAHSAFDALGLHRFLAQHVAGGGAPFALASIDGGDGYWHPRASGDDPLGMLANELLPLLDAAGLRTDSVGVLGWSMGGYGALLLARESGKDSFAGVEVVAAAAASPALFSSYEASAGGAFDDAADYASWGALLKDPGVASGIALRVSCGDNDAFTDVTRDYRAAVEPAVDGGISMGCHDNGYWRSQASAELAFLGAHLSA